MEKEIVCSLGKEGFRGHFYPECKETNKAIIFVGGASCDEKTSIAMSGFLRKEGYNVLALGFYFGKGLNKNLASIPVDYVEKAVKWLKEEQGTEKNCNDRSIHRGRIHPSLCITYCRYYLCNSDCSL